MKNEVVVLDLSNDSSVAHAFYSPCCERYVWINKWSNMRDTLESTGILDIHCVCGEDYTVVVDSPLINAALRYRNDEE